LNRNDPGRADATKRTAVERAADQAIIIIGSRGSSLKGGRTMLGSGRALTAIAVTIVLLHTGPAAAGAIPQTERPSVAPILQKATPGVVNIATKKVEVVNDPMLRDPRMREMFDIPERAMRRETQSAGSGVIIDAAQGYVLTNDHVVKGASSIEVTTKDNRRFKAQLIGRDQPTDIALLRIKGDNLSAIPLGDSDSLEVGDFVLAIGNPFGLGQTVTSGIVSALGRTGLGIEGYEDFIQTDAAINPGNSGGALITFDGRLVGINTAILSRTGGNVGIGFAIPINMARLVMNQLAANGEIRRGRIGITMRIGARDAEARRTDEPEGAVIEKVEPQSPAAAAGIAKGDIVTAANNVAIRNTSQFRNVVGLLPVGSEVDLRLKRGSDLLSTKVRVEAAATQRPTQRARRD
jgi:Do/DeqQ family serine protease